MDDSERTFSLNPDPHMQWIYEPKYRDDPYAKDLRERRAAALRSAPRWMIEKAIVHDNRVKRYDQATLDWGDPD